MEKENMTVSGDKVTNIKNKVNADGYFVDKYGNKIYPADTYKKSE